MTKPMRKNNCETMRNTFPPFASRAVPGLVEEFKAIPELAERGQRRISIFLRNLNDRLKDIEYVAGKIFSIADITAFCAVDFANSSDIGIPDDYKNLRRWFEQVSSRPSAAA